MGMRSPSCGLFHNSGLIQPMSNLRMLADAAGPRADTADARRSAVAADALLRRLILRRQVPKQSATPADFGERTAGNEAGGTAGAADHAGGDYPRQRRIDPPDAGTVHGDAAHAGSVPGGAAVRVALPWRSAKADAARFSPG